MRILGVDLPRHASDELLVENTLVLLDERGRFAKSQTIPTLPGVATAVGHPCLPYPDSDRRRPGLMETYPALILKSLLWEASPLSRGQDASVLEELFRAYEAPGYRVWQLRARTGWAEQATLLDQVLTALAPVTGYDVEPAREALLRAGGRKEVERAAGLLDACLIAGTARRYLEAPETCLFVGDREQGYLVLPADSLVRRLAVSGTKETRGRLFPSASLRERLSADADLRSVDLLAMPDRPQRMEARFRNLPHYEFDNVDEMMWWKHCRHLAGPVLPIEGLTELVVALGGESDAAATTKLRLTRSRHRTLSFRFEPPATWRNYVPTRDGKSYAFKVIRATYETL